MSISVRMNTISFWVDCRHSHLCTVDYHLILSWLLSCTFLYEWLPFLFEWMSSCTFLCKWLKFLFEWNFVMHVSLRMNTISMYRGFRHAHSVQMTFHILVYVFSSCIFCANGFPYSSGFSMFAMLFNMWIVTKYKRYINVYRILTMCLMLYNAWLARCS